MKTALIGICLLLLTGCALGPGYRRPLLPIPAQWTARQSGGILNGAGPVTDLWWKSFHDAELNSLIERAVQTNYDLQQAAARVEQARSAAGLARSSYYPQVGSGVAASRVRQIGVGLLPEHGARLFNYETNAYNLNGSLSWEIDLFGRIRRSVEAAHGDIAASEQDRRNVLISVLADVASYYAELRGAQLRLEIARRNIATA